MGDQNGPEVLRRCDQKWAPPTDVDFLPGTSLIESRGLIISYLTQSHRSEVSDERMDVQIQLSDHWNPKDKTVPGGAVR